MKFCKECGAEILESENCCPSCHKIQNEFADTRTDSDDGNSSPELKLVKDMFLELQNVTNQLNWKATAFYLFCSRVQLSIMDVLVGSFDELGSKLGNLKSFLDGDTDELQDFDDDFNDTHMYDKLIDETMPKVRDYYHEINNILEGKRYLFEECNAYLKSRCMNCFDLSFLKLDSNPDSIDFTVDEDDICSDKSSILSDFLDKMGEEVEALGEKAEQFSKEIDKILETLE